MTSAIFKLISIEHWVLCATLDCYLEFYDTEKELMVNYQLDTTDLMCSRAGNMNQRIYEDLMDVYPFYN